MINFKVSKADCTVCGLCVADCPANIIAMENGYPAVNADREARCYKCEHCLAICPTGAISILGVDPARSTPIKDAFPTATQMEALIKGRRAVRRYKDEDLDPALIQKLLDVAWHAPTGKNDRKVRLTVIDNKDVLARFRSETLDALERVADAGKLPPGMERFAEFARLWKKDKVDILFRGAPHLLVASAPKDCACPQADCFIALSYFELYAQAQGVGTVWDGLFKWTTEIIPQLQKRLGIPDDHVIGYAMAFGSPAVRYTRTVQHAPANISRVTL